MVLLLPGAAAQPAGDLVVGSSRFAGEQHWSGDLLGLRLRSIDAPGRATLSISAPFLHLETVNRTSLSAALFVGVEQANGGIARDYGATAVTADTPKAGVDLLVVPVAGAEVPTVLADSSSLTTLKSPSEALEERPYVRTGRPLLGSDIAAAVEATAASHRLRVQGTFAVSVWAWNLTIGDELVPTGTMQSPLHPDAGTGRSVSTTLEQVAQLVVRDGWLEVESDRPVQAYVDDLRVRGDGIAELAGVTGPLASGGSAIEGRLVIDGQLQLRQAWTDGRLYTRFESIEGDVTLDGQPARLLTASPAAARPGNVAAYPASGGGLPVGLGGGLVALMLAAVVAHGPVQSLRFRSIQRKFERRDYLEVLAGIDVFTRRRRFQRSANLLKAISLLSLGQFREATLFLGTLRPTDGPDPATQAFLRACAAAGQGQDADALAHLGDCFRLDPTFREEARAVPALRGLLPYFELDAGPAGA